MTEAELTGRNPNTLIYSMVEEFTFPINSVMGLVFHSVGDFPDMKAL